MKLAVFVSGSGTNFQKIIDSITINELENVSVNCLIADRNCYALERAIDNDVDAYFFDRKEGFWEEVNNVLPEDTDLIVLAGFLSIIPKEFIAKWKGKIINIHPSLLPAYGGKGMYGMNVHKAVIQNRETESGATVHYVTEGIDEGGVILQEKLKIQENETPTQLANRIHLIEYDILIRAINKIANG